VSDTDGWNAACDRCIRRAWLLARMAGHIDVVRADIGAVMALADEDLIAAVGGAQTDSLRRELVDFDHDRARAAAATAKLDLLCRCSARYPHRLRELDNPPALVHVAGGLEHFLTLIDDEPVAIVGARRSSPYGLEVARSLGRDLGRAGVPVISGMALGIDSAAHEGAASTGAPAVAVLPGGADRPYPAAKRALYRRIMAAGAAVSELPAGTAPRRWMYLARNRIIAALASMTIVVEAGERSGALLTAAVARRLGRHLGAVPGRITTPTAAGSNGLLADGATVVRGVQDVLDCVYGAGARRGPGPLERPQLESELEVLLVAIADGHDTLAALERAGLTPQQALSGLAALEIAGYVRREPGGRFTVSA
jgi:DNA processing protein